MLLSRVRSAVRNLFSRRAVDASLDDEIASFVELLTAEKMALGMNENDARRAAILELEGADHVKENVRDVRAAAWVDSLARDVRHAWRNLRRAPGFSVAVVTTLAIGIALNTAIVTLVYSAIARPLPVRDADRLVNVYAERRATRVHGGRSIGRVVHGMPSLLSYADFKAFAKAPSFASATAYFATSLSVAGIGGAPVSGQLVSCDYFGTMAVHMTLGRSFARDECDVPGAGPVVILSNSAWQTKFGSDSSVVGRVVRVNDLPLTVIGVAEPGFNGITMVPADLWVPLTMHPLLEHGRDSTLANANASWLFMAARLAPGATIAQATADESVIATRLDDGYPGRRTIPLVRRGAYANFPEVSSAGGAPLALTFFLGLSILLIAAANVTGLLLARGMAKRREIGIRLAIGASRAQLVQELLIESLLLAGGASLVGFALTAALPRLLRLLPIGAIQLDVSPDLRTTVYALCVGGLAAIVAGLAPALQSTRVDLVASVKGAARIAGRAVRPSRLRAVAVAVQIGGGAMLLAVASLFYEGTLAATTIDPGYATRDVVAISMNADAVGYDDAQANRLYATLMDRIARAPDVVGVAMADRLPLLARSSEGLTMEGEPTTASHDVSVTTVSHAYFSTMGLRLVKGRSFDSTAVENDGTREAVISATLASIWRGGDALGQRFTAGRETYRVVGIVSDAALSSLATKHERAAYFAPKSALGLVILVRTRGPATALVAQLPIWVREIDPRLIAQTQRFEDRIAQVLLPARLIGGATAALGGLALLLAAIGLAGVVSYGLSQRRQEVAVRLAVGSTGGQVVGLMMRQGLTPVGVGVVVGTGLAVAIAFVVRGLLFGVSPLSPAAYSMMMLILGCVGVLATYLPSRGAARVDPASVLREEV